MAGGCSDRPTHEHDTPAGLLTDSTVTNYSACVLNLTKAVVGAGMMVG